MTTKNTIILGVVLAVVAFTSALVGGLAANHGASLGGSINAYQAGIWQFGNGLYAGSSQQLAVDSSGNLAITNASATSTIAAGCMQLNATSSATNVKLVLSTLGATSTFKGTAYWTYGTCP